MKLAPVFVATLLAVTALQLPQGAPAARPGDPAVVSGAALFKAYCVRCHGTDGRGGGVVASTARFTPPDLTGLAAENHGVFPAERMKQVIEGRGPAAHGDRLMPVWGDVFARAADRAGGRSPADDVVRYLDSIQRRKG